MMGRIRNAAEIIAAGSSPEDIYERTIHAVEEVIPVDACELLVDQDGTLQPRATAGIDRDEMVDGPVLGRSVAERTYRTQEVRSIEDVSGDLRSDHGEEYQSLLSIPLGTYGVLQIAVHEPGAFDENARTVATLLGGHVIRVLDGLRVNSGRPLSFRAARKFVELADVMMIVLNDQGQITLANRRAEEVLGYDEDDLVGRDWFDTCVPERARDEVRAVFDQLMAGETDPDERYENAVVTKDGNDRIIEWHNTVLRNERGEITGTLRAGVDVTERTKRERQLREEHEKYAALVENSNDGICIVQDGEFVFVNERFAELHGTTPDQLVGESFLTHIDPEYRDIVEARYEQRLAGDDPPDQYEIEILDGERILEINAARIEYRGRPADMGIVRDVTDQRRRERALKRANRRYRTIVEQFPNGLVSLFDEEHRYQVVGGRGFEKLDVSAEDLEGQRLADAFPAENVEQLEPLYERALEGKASTTEVTYDGRVFRVRVVPVRDESGDVFAGMTMSQDVTDQKARKRELDAARQRYQTLLRAAPDPVFVVDAETGEIVEANRAAETLRGESREEIVGRHQTDLHPAADEEMYRTLFEEHVRDGGRKRRLPDESQIYAVREDGERIPVEISVATVDLDDGPVIYGIFRDISEQLEYERTLTSLNEATRELFEAVTPRDVGRHVVETVTDVLDLAGATFYRFDEDEGRLCPMVHDPPREAADTLAEAPAFGPDEGIAWRVFTDGELAVVDDVRTDEDVYNPMTAVRSEIIAPVGERGVLIVSDTRTGAFDERAVNLVRVLGATAEATLERVEHEQELAQREQQLQQRTRQLERVEAINGQIREVARTIVHAETRQEVEQSVCAQLIETTPFAFAWIGERDPVTDRLAPRAEAGDGQGYLEAVSLPLDDDTVTEPAVDAVRTDEPVVVSNTATNMADDPWRREAIKRGFRAAMSVPLAYQETSHGVLTIYATDQSAFSGVVKAVLGEMAKLVANAVTSIDRKRALLSDQGTELEFDIHDPSCFFLRFVQETDCTLDLDGIVSQPDDSSLVFVRVQDESPDHLITEAERASEIESAHLIESNDDTLVQFRFGEPFIASVLAEHGITLQNIAADSSGCRVTVAVPPSFDLRRVADIVTTTYPDSELLAKREQVTSVKSIRTPTDQFLEKLTARQREVVEVAYRSGYFESPRSTSSDELADKFGFSTSAFHHHLRIAERKLFEAVFDDGTPEHSHDQKEGELGGSQ